MSRVHEVIAPSNIALIKYWGKRDAERQLPANDSLSMTLSTAYTKTTAQVATSASLTSGQLALGGKAERHLAFLQQQFGFSAPLAISTENSFPAACGIASSASGLAALTIAALAAWTGAGSFEELAIAGFPRARLADLARLGSGSACRSLFGGYVHWRAEDQRVESVFPAQHWRLANLIVVLSDAPKPVSSTAAHAGAWKSPLYAPRLAGISQRLNEVKAALEARDIEALGSAIETEALDMHAVMMTGSPSAHYLTEASSRLMAWIRNERCAGRLPGWFTVDAGPNIHIICQASDADTVAASVQAAFPDARLIRDLVGDGPTLRTAFYEAPR